jgi:hypothetical protein
MTREPLPWINLLEAIRVVVRLLPDGERLADIMTDEWIKESLGLLWRCHGPVDEVLLEFTGRIGERRAMQQTGPTRRQPKFWKACF